MKKTYMTPSVEAVKIAAPVILAGSAARFDDMGGGEINLDPSTELNPSLSGDEVLGRDFDFDNF